jgi:hypothetical protein
MNCAKSPTTCTQGQRKERKKGKKRREGGGAFKKHRKTRVECKLKGGRKAKARKGRAE